MTGTVPPGRDPAEGGRPDESAREREADVARRIRAHELAAGRSVGEIAARVHQECAPRFGTTRIKAYRLAHGIALADVVEQVRARYEHDGRPRPRLGETLLSAYENAHKRPGPEYLHYLCLVYHVDPEDLGFPGQCLCGAGHRAHLPNPAVASAGVEGRRAGHGGEEDDTVLRRTLLELLAGGSVSLDGGFFASIDNIRRRMDDTLVATTVSPAMLDQWEETTAGYARQYMTGPPLRLLCDILLDFGETRRMCERRQPLEYQERLCRLAARLAGLTGIIMIDLADHRLARSFFRTARTAADETGDRALRAWVAAREAMVPLYYGDPREAMPLARKSEDLAGRTPCPAAVMAPVLEARAIARMAGPNRRAVDHTKRALARARAVFSRLSPEDQADTAFGYTERQLLFHQGDALVEVGAPGEAEVMLKTALGRYAVNERLDRTLVRLDRARCRLLEGDADEALRIGRASIEDLPADHRCDIVLHRARELAAAAADRCGDSREVRELRDALALPPGRAAG